MGQEKRGYRVKGVTFARLERGLRVPLLCCNCGCSSPGTFTIQHNILRSATQGNKSVERSITLRLPLCQDCQNLQKEAERVRDEAAAAYRQTKGYRFGFNVMKGAGVLSGISLVWILLAFFITRQSSEGFGSSVLVPTFLCFISFVTVIVAFFVLGGLETKAADAVCSEVASVSSGGAAADFVVFPNEKFAKEFSFLNRLTYNG